MVFAEALTNAEQFRQFTQAVSVPVLANMTEFGCTPLLSLDVLRATGIRLILYPLTAFRAMNAAASHVYEALRTQGDQRSLLSTLETRDELYDVLDYHTFERQLDRDN